MRGWKRKRNDVCEFLEKKNQEVMRGTYWYELPMRQQIDIARAMSARGEVFLLLGESLAKRGVIGPGEWIALQRDTSADRMRRLLNAARALQVPALIECLREIGEMELAEFVKAPDKHQPTTKNDISMEGSPFASAVMQSKGATVMSINTFMYDEKLSYFRKAICLAMDEAEGWYALLKKRGLLGGQGMEQYVSRLKTQWANHRSGEPTLSVLQELFRHDREFAQLGLTEFCALLNSLNIASVQAEVVKLTSWLEEQTNKTRAASETSFSANSGLRKWLLENRVCDNTNVDTFIVRLREAGTETVDDLRLFDKSDFKECGFNITQANRAFEALKKK